eukprot:GCRY01002676.1.p1 GENE.GCRY01002676.1~~GCRY01002676.1.p1  ORF type:complete len:462 (+),score=84.75 GCRY01002676.1:123-1508(+)
MLFWMIKMFHPKILAFVVCFGFILGLASADEISFAIDNEHRSFVFFHKFGFEEGGELSMTIKDFSLSATPSSGTLRIGILAKRSDTSVSVVSSTDTSISLDAACFLSFQIESTNGDMFFDYTDFINGTFATTRLIERSGMYSFYLANCDSPAIGVTGKLSLALVNPHGNYLSVGDQKLPSLYTLLGLSYLGLFVYWVVMVRRSTTEVFKIHYLMGMLIILKTLTLFALALRYKHIETTGEGMGWNVVYLIFAILKGTFLFAVIALIGTGWSIMKGYLSKRDKNIFMVVLPLQIIANIAMIVLQETSPGEQEYYTWTDILRLVDIICCVAILFPVVWSIKMLKEGSETDGKAARNLDKLKLFRGFYLAVICYIYFTRIFVYLMMASVNYTLTWFAVLLEEAGTMVFYCYVGYKFRPVPNNPYLEVAESDAEGEMQEISHSLGDDNVSRVRPGDRSENAEGAV